MLVGDRFLQRVFVEQGLLDQHFAQLQPQLLLAVQRVGSSLAAQVGMLGPVSTIVMSLWLLDEPMGPAQIAGTVLVLIGVLLVTRLRR